MGFGSELSGADVREHDSDRVAGAHCVGGGVMQQMHLFPKIRERVLALLGGYVSSPSITPEGIEGYIVPPALGVNSGVIGALLLGARALEQADQITNKKHNKNAAR